MHNNGMHKERANNRLPRKHFIRNDIVMLLTVAEQQDQFELLGVQGQETQQNANWDPCNQKQSLLL